MIKHIIRDKRKDGKAVRLFTKTVKMLVKTSPERLKQ